MNFEAQTVMAVLGPLFLMAGALRCVSARRWHPQGIAWLLLGAVFSAVSLWLQVRPA